MDDDRPMWGNNRAVAPTPRAAIVAVDLGDNFTVKGHHLSMIKDRQFDGRTRADPHKHIAEFVKICGMFRYGNTNVDAIKLKLFPSSLSGDAKVWFNELSPGVITTWEEMRQAFVIRLFPPAICEMDATVVDDITHRRSVMTNPWDDLNKKKPTMHTEDIEETTMVEVLEIGVTVNHETITKIHNLVNGKTYDPPVNPNAKTTIIYDDSEDEVDESEKEEESSSSKQTKSNPPPLKAYKPKIPYPQCLRKEKMEERYAKFIDLIKEVKINVPLVDVLTGMPNHGKFSKDLVSNKSKMEQIFDAFLNEEYSAIVQNKLPPKLGDPVSFLIPCTLANSVECLAWPILAKHQSDAIFHLRVAI
ncbi:hypothetical protein Tco_1367825 [Tanacetum coccineum]